MITKFLAPLPKKGTQNFGTSKNGNPKNGKAEQGEQVDSLWTTEQTLRASLDVWMFAFPDKAELVF